MSKELFKGKMPQPTLGDPVDPEKWWQRPAWQPGTPRPFTAQHNFGKPDQVHATNDRRTVSVKKKDEQS